MAKKGISHRECHADHIKLTIGSSRKISCYQR